MPHPNRDRHLHRLRVESNHEVERDERVFSNCETCSTELNDDVTTRTNDNGDEHCEDCYCENYSQCNSCGEELHNDDALSVNNSREHVCEGCYDEHYGTCERCEYATEYDHLVYNDTYGGDLCHSCNDEYEDEHSSTRFPDWSVMDNDYVNSCRDFVNPRNSGYNMSQTTGKVVKQVFDVEPRVRQEFKDSFTLIKSSRYQGVEIEFNTNYSVSRDEIYHRLNAMLMTSRTSRFRKNDWHDYTERSLFIANDGSVTSAEHEHGAEIVMSPRRGDVLYRDLEVVNKSMKQDFDAYISSRCGYHLHIDTRDYDWYHFAVLLAMTKLIEPHIFSWLPSSRRTSRWCHPVSQNWQSFKNICDRETFVEFYYDGDSYRDDKYHDKRYCGLNLHSHFQANQGTELRYHSGTLNPDKMLHWSIVWSQIIDTCYQIGNDLHYNRDPRDDYWFGKTDFIKSLSDVVCKETRVKINDTLSLIRGLDSTQDILEAQRKTSQLIRREIGLKPNSWTLDGKAVEYDFNRLTSLVGVATGYGNHNRPTMTANCLFDLFNIPDKTRIFYRNWLADRMSSNYYADPHHVEKCFTKTTRFVEYNKNLRQFNNVSWMKHRIPLTERLNEIYSDVRYRLQPSLVSEYIDT